MPPSLCTGGFASPPRSTRHGCGFSLIELCVCLLLLSLMVGFSVQATRAERAQDCTSITQQQLARITTALQDFVAHHGRYPLPAPPSLRSSDGDYGSEAAAPGDPRILPIGGTVLRGALPHVTLNLNTSDAADCWGHKFGYAVTTSLTTAVGYANPGNTGQITVMRGTLASPLPVSMHAAYVVLSHGDDALGASGIEYDGVLITCNAALVDGSMTRIDKENCDDTNPVFFQSDFNPSDAGPLFFDDLVITAERAPPLPLNCAAGVVTWGSGCQGNVLITLAGIGVSVTNIAPGYTGVALATCNNGTYTTLGVCVP